MKKLFALLLISSFMACQPEGRIFIEHQALSPEVEWLRKDKRTFKVPIENMEQVYNFQLTFRYANGYQYRTAMLKVTETSPSGKETTKEYELQIRDEKGNYLGDPGYDIIDSEHSVEPNKKYEETGTYTYVIEHIMSSDPLNFAMEVGIIVDKVN